MSKARAILDSQVEQGSLVDRPQSKSPSKWVGRLIIVIAAVLWSTSGFFAKAPTFEDWPPEIRGSLLAFWRAAFAALVLVFFIRKISWTWKLIPTSLCFAMMNWAFLNSLVHCEATLAIWLQYSAPAWIFVGSLLFLRERPGPRDWSLFGFAAVGVAIILSNELFGASPIGVRYGIASGFFFALVLITIRWCREVDSAWIIFLNHFVTLLFFAPAMFASGVYPSGWQYLFLLGFGALQMGIPYVLFAYALRSLTSHEASGLALLEPILVPAWVWLAWRNAPDYQSPTISTLLGAGLILAGLIIRYLPKRKASGLSVKDLVDLP